MLLQGDLNKIIEKFNDVFAGAFSRIDKIEERLEALEAEKTTTKTTTRVNKPKEV